MKNNFKIQFISQRVAGREREGRGEISRQEKLGRVGGWVWCVNVEKQKLKIKNKLKKFSCKTPSL